MESHLGSLRIRPMVPEDWSDVREIYAEGIETGLATFELEVPEWEAWDGGHLRVARLVAEREGVTVGWAALSPVSKRSCYAGVAEVTVYVRASARSTGVGKALLDELVASSERAGIWTLQAAMFSENRASIELHRACGFRLVGTRERIGRLRGVWKDTTLMERRSPAI